MTSDGYLGPVQQRGGALIELLAACPAAEPAVTLGGALGPLRHGFRSTFQAPHPRPPLHKGRPYTQPSPRRPEAVVRALTEPSEYGRVILLFTVLRRLDCVLESTKPTVLAEYTDKRKLGLNPEL